MRGARRGERADNFGSVQALRGLAAVGVVLFHLLPFEAKYLPGSAIRPEGFSAGAAGVDVFFTLSGFVVTWTTMASAGGVGEAQRFLLRRLMRIYPPYWCVCAVLLVVLAAAPDLLGRAAPPYIATSLLLLPCAGRPLLLVAWTLVFEVYFYLVFAGVLSIGRSGRMRTVLLGGWVLAVLVLRLWLRPSRSQVTLDLVLSPLVLEFAAGCAAAFLCRADISARLGWAALLFGALSLVAALVWSASLLAMPWWRVAAFGTSSALLLTGCVACDRIVSRVLPRVLCRLGDSSYSLYLSHLLSIAVVGHFWSAQLAAAGWGNHLAALAVALAVAIGAGSAMHGAVERPLLRAVRRTLPNPTSAPLVHPA